jgi:hypothetical protein
MYRLPAGFNQTRDFAIHGGIAQFAATQTKSAVNATWATSDLATVAQTRWVGIAGQLL